jgi:hypothetical protein
VPIHPIRPQLSVKNSACSTTACGPASVLSVTLA